MFWFFVGAVCGAVIGVLLVNAANRDTNKKTSKDAIATKQQNVVSVSDDQKVVALNIPIEVLTNVYALSVAHYTVQYKKNTYSSGKTFEHISIDCELHYMLNGRKEGKRSFVFSYYDQNGNVYSHSETMAYCLTDSGVEIVHTEHYVPWSDLPKKIGVSVREIC